MNTRILVTVGCLGALVAPVQAQLAPSSAPGFVSEVMLQIDASMQKFIALAEAMPAEKFSWSPGPGTMTVAKVYGHVARYNYLYPATSLATPAPGGRDADAAEDLTEKAQIVARLRESHDHVRAVVKALKDPAQGTAQYGRAVPQWSVLLQLATHMNEHLGQSIAYARMNGVVPPWSR